MTSTTLGIKVDDALRQRIRTAASQIERTPHWLIKQAIFNFLDSLDRGVVPPMPGAPLPEGQGAEESGLSAGGAGGVEVQPFLEFAQSVSPQTRVCWPRAL